MSRAITRDDIHAIVREELGHLELDRRFSSLDELLSIVNDRCVSLRDRLKLLGDKIDLAKTPEANVQIMQEDFLLLLKALDLPDHARPTSCHAILHTDILPAIAKLKERQFPG